MANHNKTKTENDSYILKPSDWTTNMSTIQWEIKYRHANVPSTDYTLCLTRTNRKLNTEHSSFSQSLDN